MVPRIIFDLDTSIMLTTVGNKEFLDNIPVKGYRHGLPTGVVDLPTGVIDLPTEVTDWECRLTDRGYRLGLSTYRPVLSTYRRKVIDSPTCPDRNIYKGNTITINETAFLFLFVIFN